MNKCVKILLLFLLLSSCSVFNRKRSVCLNVVGLPSEITIEKEKIQNRSQNGWLEGLVLNREDSLPLENASIIIAQKEALLYQQATDSLGRFRVEIPAGTYQITVYKDFFRTIEDSLRVLAEQKILISAYLGNEDLDIFYETRSAGLLKKQIKLQNQKRKTHYFSN
ncbi:MAG: hypothetical protein CME35_03505 [Gramella sp.]|nr:hypothetical protein [Christiangramia sp.]|tara:strand:+ start:441 stop:938 length:498 start_codon:yes stop_codon:yes gene_type:complete